LIQTRTLARDIFDIQGAVDLPAVAPGPDHATDPEHPEVPGNPRLAHPKMNGQVVDALLAHSSKALQNAQPGGVGEGQKVVRKLVPLAGDKHKGSFI
jgi:hypothetical protein